MKKTVKSFSVNGLVISILEIILGFAAFIVGIIKMSDILGYLPYVEYNGDFYTDCYYAITRINENLNDVYNLLCSFLIFFGILLMLVAIKNLVISVKGEATRKVYLLNESNDEKENNNRDENNYENE